MTVIYRKSSLPNLKKGLELPETWSEFVRGIGLSPEKFHAGWNRPPSGFAVVAAYEQDGCSDMRLIPLKSIEMDNGRNIAYVYKRKFDE